MSESERIVRLLQEPHYERQPGEPSRAWAGFRTYRDLDRHRSVLVAFRNNSGRQDAKVEPGQWRVWARDWRWVDRAAAWDAHMDQIEREVKEEAARAAVAQLSEARKAQRVREMELGNKLLQRAEEILALPVIEVSTERDVGTGKVTQTFKPGKWRLADAAAIARMGVELKRLSLDMETSRASVRIDVEDEVRRMARDNGWDEEAAVATALQYVEDRGERTG